MSSDAIRVLAYSAVRQFVAEAQGGYGPSAERILADQREQMRRYWIAVHALIAHGCGGMLMVSLQRGLDYVQRLEKRGFPGGSVRTVQLLGEL